MNTKIADEERAFRDLIRESNALAVFLYGSRVEGFSNTYSDLDVCFITDNEEGPSYAKIREMEVHIEKITLKRLENSVATPQIQEGTRSYSQASITWSHRIKIGIPIQDAHGVFAQLKKKVDFKSMERSLTFYHSSEAITSLNDSLGALKSGDSETALITARLAIESAMKAYLCSTGIIDPKTKWIYRYLLAKRKTEDQLIKEFKFFERACVKNIAEIGRYVDRASEFANALTTRAQMTYAR